MSSKRMLSAVLFALLFASFWNPQGAFSQSPQDQVMIYVNLWHNRLELRQMDGTVLCSFRIGPGAKDTPSPVGHYRVIHKSKDWGGGFGTRWLGLNVSWGLYGIHGTNRPELVGRYVSHGCFRMRNRDIEKLYDLVPLGTPVLIDGPIMGHEDLTYRILVTGSKGALVQIVQNRLKAAGYYHGKCHGIFDRSTRGAVIRFQKAEGLEVTGQIQHPDLVQLGIIE
ncbi:L,D-transpeptidase family protein [Brevibacillus sp. SYP-B805]|uniref:L,D-transpeptidase family protein n=1 Tax=Brevibacillus sp. SYP-B805 TaxID=1578199 RepID=UPI0013ED8682|nr:L,D-transpeptidase family protein [Brevibacillus sp. SYP-B805]NGQ93635.1 L,D-transpeptidase family protein [Brevibacillus sp. SYP-B805]